MNNKCVIGIDLGTSSAKVLCRYKNGDKINIKEKYDENTPRQWQGSVKKALAGLAPEINADDIEGIGLSAQVGTYITETGGGVHVTMWNDGKDGAYLKKLLGRFTQEEFLREISMPHPNMTSYPAPQLMQINEKFKDIRRVCQPKDFLCETLTGNMATDMYSWRGLADLKSGRYSGALLGFAGVGAEKLPPFMGVTDKCGALKPELAEECGLPGNIPVFVGCNDFFAALLGMGMQNYGDAFDITGTSEHIGVISEDIVINEKLVSGGYFDKNVCYGVTSSSGAAIDWALGMFGDANDTAEDISEILDNGPPVFLPYIKGEARAPVWDPDAKGVFFGINDKARGRELKYSVFEGVCFALFNIWENIGRGIGRLTVAGGAANNVTLNAVKAELFGVPVDIPEETDASALGAAMIASVGAGWHDSVYAAARQMGGRKNAAVPKGACRGKLLQRYETFKRLYPLLKTEFKNLGGM